MSEIVTSFGRRGLRARLAIPMIFILVAAMFGLGAAPANAATGSLLITVVSDAGGAPIANAQVSVLVFNGTYWDSFPGGYTDVNGQFLISNATPGQYQLYFNGPYPLWAPETYNNHSDYGGADTYNLAAGSSSLTIGLAPAATISGTVTQTGGGFPAGGYVQAFSYPAVDGVYNSTSGSGSIDSSGHYTVAPLPAGQFVLKVVPPTGSTYVGQYFPSTYDPSSATPISVTAAQHRTGYDMQIAHGATISGTVTGPSSAAAAGVQVELWGYYQGSSYFDRITNVATDSAGAYSIPALTPGSYSLRFNAAGTAWASEWFDNKSDAASATPVVLTAAQVRSGTNAVLAAGATISGTITDAVSGLPLQGAADVSRKNSDGTWERASYAQADASGHYAMSGLSAGTYRVALEGSGYDYAVEYTGDSFYEDTAEQIVLATGATSGGHDGALVKGVSLSLKSRDKTTHVPVNAWATIEIERSPGVWVAPTLNYGSGDIGVLNSSGLPPGTYRFHWADHSGAGYLDQWWDNKPTESASTVVVLAPGASFTGTADMSTTPTVPVSPAPVPTISGAAQTGNTVTAVPGTWGPATVALSYQWFVDGVAKSGATDATFVVGADAVGLPLTVAVTGASAGYVSVTKTSAGVTVTAPPVSPAPVPTISGVAQLGNTLTAVPGAWGPAPVTLSYQWFVDGVAKSGATATTFVIGVAEVGLPITVAVTGAKTGYTSVTQTSAAVTVTATPVSPAPVPTISGVAQLGNTLTAVPGTWGPAPVTLSYQWFVDGVAKSGATDATLVLGADAVGLPVTVTVTGAKEGYASVSRTSAATPAIVPMFADVPSGSQFSAEMAWMYTSAISTGYIDGVTGYRNFHPADSVTRRAMAPFLYRAAGSPAFTPPTTQSFTDVAPADPFYKEIEWMKAQALSLGTSNGNGTFSYKPGDPVSRQAMATFLYRAAGSPAFTPPTAASFTDVATTTSVYPQIEWMKAAAITNGTSNGNGTYSYKPADPVSRSAMSAFLYRANPDSH